MALVNCPECDREISDRAHNCPFCGFPLEEHLRAIEIEKNEAILKKEKENKIQEYRKMHNFIVFGTEISLNKNQCICSAIASEYEYLKSEANRTLLLALSKDRPSQYNSTSFPVYLRDLLERMFKPAIRNTINVLKEHCEDYNSNNVFWDEGNLYEESITKLYDATMDKWNELYSNFEIKKMNAHSKYYDDYMAAGRPSKPIGDVYAKSLGGLVGASIKKNVVNSIASSFTYKIVINAENSAAEKYYNAVLKVCFDFDVEIICYIAKFVETIIYSLKNYLLEYLLQEEVIFEGYDYPEGTE